MTPTKRKSRDPIARRKLRHRLAEAQNWRCAHCACLLEPTTATIDHVIALGVGGPDEWENMVAACSPCNTDRSKVTAYELGRLRPWWVLNDQWAATAVPFNPVIPEA